MAEAARSGPDRLSVGSWVLYDLANTIFALGVVGRYFPEWLTAVDQPDSALALVEAAAGVVVIFLAPWAGARSDARGARVPTLRVTTLIAVGAAAGLAAGSVTLTLILLGIGLIGFNVGSVVYDALLVDVSTPENRGRISGLGVGIGYIGSFIGLGIGVITLEILEWSFAATFKTLALAFLVFALPAFFFIKERQGIQATEAPRLRDVPSRIISSWRRASGYEGMVRFLVSRFLYTDAINTLIGGFLTHLRDPGARPRRQLRHPAAWRWPSPRPSSAPWWPVASSSPMARCACCEWPCSPGWSPSPRG